MSRRNQSRRRRTYGRRQHEVRERRPETRDEPGWLGTPGLEGESDWQPADAGDERDAYESYGGFGR